MNETSHPTGAPWRNFYGRFKGKGLRKSQEAYLDEDLAKLSPGPVSWEENPERRPLDLQSLFGGRPVWLEIGFGGGEHMVRQAAAHPEVGLIGCEPFINGVAMLLGKIREAGVENLRVHPGDARQLILWGHQGGRGTHFDSRNRSPGKIVWPGGCRQGNRGYDCGNRTRPGGGSSCSHGRELAGGFYGFC